MRILTLTTLYPNAAAPAHGVFVENRMRAFAARTGSDVRVVAPVPWFPVGAAWAGRYAHFARAPRREERFGIAVEHPRYAIPPKFSMTYGAAALERCFYRAARRLIEDGWDFDLIDAHYLYPDGVAAARAARRLGKPAIITARGSDVSLIPSFPRQRAMILEAIRNADAVVAVAAALKAELVRLGAPAEKISVLRNGVDLSLFRPLDREAVRAGMDLSGPVVASVGHLIERKGHHLAIEAIARLPAATLLIAGDGEDRRALERLAAARGVAGRVRFLGEIAHERLPQIYNAADALILASSREGWPNVLLEAMACGTPVAAAPVWGTPEIVTAPAAGTLAAERSAPAMTDALTSLLAAPPGRPATRAHAEKFGWDETSDGLASLFAGVAAKRLKTLSVRTRPLSAARTRAPKLIVTIDAEETFDWACFDRPQLAIASPADIDRFQKLAASFGARPLYFLTWPLIEDAKNADYFRELLQAGAADAGLHFHQWTTPPADGFDGEYYSYQCNIPDSVQREKLRALASAFRRSFGFDARAHRAGRYGISPSCYAALAAAGIDLDFSPGAGFDFSAAGGPDFSAMKSAPFVVDANGTDIFVTPVCSAKGLRAGGGFLPQPAGEPGFARPGRRFSRIFSEPARITCEGMRFSDLAALTRRLLRDGAPVLTFTLHSTSMTPGGNPYASDAAAVDAMLETARRYLDFFKHDLGGEFLGLESLAELYGAPRRPGVNLNRPLSAAS